MVAEGLVGRDGDGLVGSPYALRARAERAAVGLIVGGDEIIHAIDFIHVVAFAHGITLGNDGALGLVDGTAHVGFQLGAFHLAIAVDGINLAIVVEEHGEVVDASLHIVVLPRSANILRSVALQSLAVHIRIDIELSVGMADAGSPDALSVDLLVVLQCEGIVVEVETVEAVADVLPVHQVFRVEDNQSGHGVHGGARQIVVIAHAEDVGVGELIVEQRIGEGAVAVVGCPRLGLSRCGQREEKRKNKEEMLYFHAGCL